ncbi:MAG: SDR family NAD(P)-dependent oxidoreductase [Gemmatimonadota bacterium]|nr:MAG: SDR family NAD(P)-dependent oxidoreductase [Gemmatimonadota bacterium]
MAEAEGVGKAVVVTGASRGLGRSIAMDLSARGFRVFAGVRKAADADRFREENLEQLRPIMLDVTDAGTIESAAEEVAGATGERGIFGLVNNAGIIGVYGPVEQISMAAVEEILRVNLVGAMAVTQRFLPQLREGKGRIVNISTTGKISFPFASVYCASKFGLEAVSDALRVELNPWGIPVSIVQPGLTDTEIRRVAMQRWGEQRGGLSADERELYEDKYEKLQSVIERLEETAAGHEYVTEAVLHALTAQSPKTRYGAGPDWEQWATLIALPDDERDEVILKMFE